MKYPPNYRNCLKLQEAAITGAARLSEDIEATSDIELRARASQSLASLCRAFDTLENRKRIIRMKPLPKSIDVKDMHKGRRRAEPSLESSFTEEAEPTQAAVAGGEAG